MDDNSYDPPQELTSASPSKSSRGKSAAFGCLIALGIPPAIFSAIFAVCAVGELDTGPRERYMLTFFTVLSLISGLIAAVLFLAARAKR